MMTKGVTIMNDYKANAYKVTRKAKRINWNYVNTYFNNVLSIEILDIKERQPTIKRITKNLQSKV